MCHTQKSKERCTYTWHILIFYIISLNKNIYQLLHASDTEVVKDAMKSIHLKNKK